jgi:hypothetical protein
MRRIEFRRTSTRLTSVACAACLIALLRPDLAAAQAAEPPETPPIAPAADQAPDIRPRRASLGTRLYFGMWTTHLREEVVTIDTNWLVGVSHGSFYAGTFVNSFGRRAYTAGYQRLLARAGDGPVSLSLGFRAGAISGYDGRFMRIARQTPVLPMVQAFGLLDVGRTGVELSYTLVVVSVAMSYRF